MRVSDAPEQYDCIACKESGKRNRARGRECLLGDELVGIRDLAENPILFEFKLRNQPPISGSVTSESELIETLDRLLELHQTEKFSIALRRLGKGLCPRSFPLSRQSYYFLELYRLTRGEGYSLARLPLSGGVLDQPNIFYRACSAIDKAVDSFKKEQDAKQDKGKGETPHRGDGKGKPYSTPSNG